MIRLALLHAIWLFACAPGLRAQEAPSWLGRKVVTKARTPLKIDGKVVDEDLALQIYTVERLEGGNVFLAYKRAKGWVPVSSVIPAEDAIDHFTRLIDRDPGAAWALDRRGQAFGLAGQYDKAIADLDAAIKLEPRLVSAYAGRGAVRMTLGQFPKAISDFDAALRLEPRADDVLELRGMVRLSMDDYPGAIVDFDEAIRLDPEPGRPYLLRAQALLFSKEYVRAGGDFDEAIRRDPKLAEAYAGRAATHILKDDIKGALRDLDVAFDLGMRNVKVLGLRAEIRLDERLYKGAMEDCDEILRIEPENTKALNIRSWIFATCPDARFRDGTKAVESASKACALGEWRDAEHIKTLAAAYAESGDFERAIEFQQKANRLFVDDGNRKLGESALDLYRNKRPYRDDPGDEGEESQ